MPLPRARIRPFSAPQFAIAAAASGVHRWAATRSEASSTTAHIVERDVQLMEQGSVSSFTITGEPAEGLRIMARWYRSNPTNGDRTVLQPQVPAVGSMIRIWAVSDASADDPHIVEAIDPSVMSKPDE